MIVLRNLTLRRGPKVVLQSASVTLNPGERVGLVGRNGAGKSTLFALLAGRLAPDQGDFEMPPRWCLAEVAQHMPEEATPATEFVLQGDAPLMRARAELADAEASGDGEAMAHAHLALADAGAFDAEARAQALLMGLGFAVGQLQQAVNQFSGGWRMRLQLARALMSPSDLLLLDEPTNHLDLDALVWLEGWLKRYAGTMIVISHDREFLDAITTVTLHLEDAGLTRYGGNYSAFEMQRAERMVLQQAAYDKQQERMAHLQRFIDRFKAKATKAKQAQSRVKALARMEKLAPVLTASDFAFEFREPLGLPNPMLALRELDCGYAPGQPIVRGVSTTVLAGQRIGILGANGQGKSTLVKTVAQTIPKLAGTMTEGKGLAIGYFAQQEMDVLHEEDAPLAHMLRLARTQGPAGSEQQLRNFLGQFHFAGEMVHQPIGTLSGGEQARLVLASLVWQRPNLLLLDEPTNHLDLTTREALSMALNEFEGSVMLVSHDRALLREVCDEFWLVVDGALQPFDGDLDDYQQWLAERAREAQRAAAGKPARPPQPETRPAAVAAPAPAVRKDGGKDVRKEDRKTAAQARQQRAAQSRPLRNELQQGEARMQTLAAEREAIEAQIVAGTLSGFELADAGRQLNHIAAEVAVLEERWMELSEAIDAIERA